MIALAVWIWHSNLSWLNEAADTLPILASLPLLLWLGWPWKRSLHQIKPWRDAILAASFLLAGTLTGMVFLMALGWTLLFHEWLRSGFAEHPLGHRRLSVLAFLSFPWLITDFSATEWWFRLSGTCAVEKLFQAMGFQVERSGMILSLEGFPVEVGISCAGMNGLQGILIVGTAVAIQIFRKQSRFWLVLALLPLLAWMSNTVRIAVIAAAGLTYGAEFAGGLFHTWGGLGAITVMFLLSMGFLRLLSRRPRPVVHQHVS